MLRAGAGGEMIDHREGLGVDHVDLAGHQIGRIDPRQRARHRRAEIVRPDFRIDVGGIDHRRHRGIRLPHVEGVGRPELEGGLADEILAGPVMLDEAAAQRGALLGAHAIGRHRQGLRGFGQAIRTGGRAEAEHEQAKQSRRNHQDQSGLRAEGGDRKSKGCAIMNEPR